MTLTTAHLETLAQDLVLNPSGDVIRSFAEANNLSIWDIIEATNTDEFKELKRKATYTLWWLPRAIEAETERKSAAARGNDKLASSMLAKFEGESQGVVIEQTQRIEGHFDTAAIMRERLFGDTNSPSVAESGSRLQVPAGHGDGNRPVRPPQGSGELPPAGNGAGGGGFIGGGGSPDESVRIPDVQAASEAGDDAPVSQPPQADDGREPDW